MSTVARQAGVQQADAVGDGIPILGQQGRRGTGAGKTDAVNGDRTIVQANAGTATIKDVHVVWQCQFAGDVVGLRIMIATNHEHANIVCLHRRSCSRKDTAVNMLR